MHQNGPEALVARLAVVVAGHARRARAAHRGDGGARREAGAVARRVVEAEVPALAAQQAQLLAPVAQFVGLKLPDDASVPHDNLTPISRVIGADSRGEDLSDGVLARALPLHGAPDDDGRALRLGQNNGNNGREDESDEEVLQGELHFARKGR